MLILIEKDTATRVPREVETIEQAQAIVEQGFAVFVDNGDGTATPLAEYVAAQDAPEAAPVKIPTKPTRGQSK